MEKEKTQARIEFSYNLEKQKMGKEENKILSNKQWSTGFYPTFFFYKNITRLFIPSKVDCNG
jgi:hypothetical protein